MSANKEATSSSSSGDAHAEKSVDKLSVKEFRERFCIPNGVFVELTDGEVVTTENSEDNAILFTKEQFNAGLWFPLPSLVKEFLHFTQIPPTYIHPNMVRVLMGCSILSMLFNLDLRQKNDIFSFVACLPSLQLVTSLPDSTKGVAKGHVLVKGLWAGSAVHPDRPFAPNQSLEVPGQDKRGKLVEWVEKASFDRLNRLFEIAAAERSCETLLSVRNLRSVTQEPQPYVLNILLRRLPKEVVAGEHFVLKDLPFYAAVRKADARSCKAHLDKREKKRQEGLLRKAPGDKRPASSPPAGAPAKKKKVVVNKGKEVKLPTPPKEIVIPPSTFVKEITIREPDHPVLPSVSSSFGRLVGLNHSGPSMSMAGRLALLVEETTSINQPGSPHPDADAAGASCAATLSPLAPPTEEMGAESQGLPSCEPSPHALVPVKGLATRRSRPARDLKFGLIGRLQDRFLETIKVSCSETEMVLDGGSLGETQPAENDGALDPEEESLSDAASGGSPVDDAACISASPFNYAKLEEKLKRIPPGSDFALPSAKMFEAAEMVYGIRGMAQQHDLFTDLLRTADYMKAFVSQRRNSEKELRLKLEQDNEALRMAQLRGDVRQLRTEVSIEKKQREDLQLRLSAQKGELEGEFAAEREKLEADYQKQVDEMFFFSYRCCMKKHGIKRDVHSIPPGEEEKLRGKPSQ
ncbi:hypothetical protein AAG906_020011 [Vitis piasezkii]